MYRKYEALLKERGITSYRVSKETGIRESVLSEWKRRSDSSHPGISFKNLMKIAQYFGVPLDYFKED